jgi:hypothetical protein
VPLSRGFPPCLLPSARRGSEPRGAELLRRTGDGMRGWRRAGAALAAPGVQLPRASGGVQARVRGRGCGACGAGAAAARATLERALGRRRSGAALDQARKLVALEPARELVAQRRRGSGARDQAALEWTALARVMARQLGAGGAGVGGAGARDGVAARGWRRPRVPSPVSSCAGVRLRFPSPWAQHR